MSKISTITSVHPLKKLGSEIGSFRKDRSILALNPFGGSLVIFTPDSEHL